MGCESKPGEGTPSAADSLRFFSFFFFRSAEEVVEVLIAAGAKEAGPGEPERGGADADWAFRPEAISRNLSAVERFFAGTGGSTYGSSPD